MTDEAPPSQEVAELAATQRLVTLAPLRLRDAVTGQPPRLSTGVRVGLRAGRLLVRFDGRDDGVVATHTRRDAPLWEEDVFEVFLSATSPPTVYYEFEVNPRGAVFDARVVSPSGDRASMSVDASFQAAGLTARAGTRSGSWWALLAIPLAALGASRATRLAANFFRIDRGPRDEYSAWSPTFADPPDFHVPARFGTLRLPA
jgi:hypothetical protein